MSDLIERQVAIDLLKKWADGYPYIETDTELAIKEFQELPSAQPTEASCWGCNCQKMEGLKEQKTFSEMVHLHDADMFPSPCQNCRNNPANGGSGICHCTLGNLVIY